MFPWLQNILLAVFILGSLYLAIISGLVGKIAGIVGRFERAAKSLERQGKHTSDWKERLKPLMKYFPPANVQTIGRGVVLNGINGWIFSRHDFAWWLAPLFIAAWLTDFTDGLKARYERERRGRPLHTGIGRYLDPLIDIPTSLVTGLLLWSYYEHGWMIATLFILTTIRFVLFLIYRIWAWIAKAPGILPSDIAGQSKAWFLAASFGLVLVNRHSPSILTSAEMLLLIGLLLEVRGLSNQFLSALGQFRQVRAKEK